MKLLIFQEVIFRAQKIKNPLLRNVSYFRKWNILAPNLKKFLYFSKELAKPENQKFHIFCLLRENFSNINAKENVSYTFPYKEAKFSKLK